ncbi:MAG: T9SS type A sorting domain-containing protein [Bacteroidetes bacterium]|nr:T9SS type A sorting domain-containing protein [Bacteroidota bacterium]
MKFLIFCSIAILYSGGLSAQVPAYGHPGSLDIATWNLDWFGSSKYGPSDDQLQSESVGRVLHDSEIDIWCFEEVADTNQMNQILGQYGNYGHVYARYWQDQKIAWVWKHEEWEYLDDSMILTNHSVDFAHGRLPLYCVLKSKMNGDTLHLLGLHLKANTGDEESQRLAWESRKASINLLNEWVSGHNDSYLILAGDWNDGLKTSVYHDTLSSLIQLRASGTFLTMSLDSAGLHSWYYGGHVIDHLWTLGPFLQTYELMECRILPMDLYFADYPNTVSDHLPVFCSFNRLTTALINPESAAIQVYPNPSKGEFYLSGAESIENIQVFSIQGIDCTKTCRRIGRNHWQTMLSPGIYQITFQAGEHTLCRRLVLRP